MNKAEAENEIYDLMKRVNRYLMAGDLEEVNRIQLEISNLQRKYGAVNGRGKEEENDEPVRA
jgi:hypothetical protein